MHLCESAFPALKAIDPVFIVSKANGGHQGPHTDAPAGSILPIDTPDIVALSQEHERHIRGGIVPLSVLVPMDPGARLLVWPGSHRIVWAPEHPSIPLPDKVVAQVVDVPLHSFAIFRQDLVHAGDGYVSSNLRSHFFLDPKEGPEHRVRESTGDTVTHFVDETFFVLE
jgi:hypothetical protein